jgi:lipase
VEAPQLQLISANGQQLAVWDWPGDDPPFLFAHATGFHARCWDRIIRMFPGRHCIALDARGHGHSSQPELPCLWRDLGKDLAAVAGRLNLRHALGIGHSSGGHMTVQAAAERPETYAALLLLDPTIYPREEYGKPGPDASFTLRRRAVWNSADEMFERFRGRHPFSLWQPGILRDYCDFGILPQGSEYVLACPPAVEASIYENSKTSGCDVYPEIAAIRQPVVVMRGGIQRMPGTFDPAASPTAADLASKFANGRDLVLPGCSHYIPMEMPGRVAEEIGRLSAEISLTLVC